MDCERINTEIFLKNSNYDGEAIAKQKQEQIYLNIDKSEKQGREVLWDMMLEEDGVYIGHIQWRIYRTMPEEGASASQAVTVAGPIIKAVLGAQEPSQASHLQKRNVARQTYIVPADRGEVVSQPSPVIGDGPLNHSTSGR